MEAFHWDSIYLTDIELVDQQHHHLVDVLNSYSDMLTKDSLDLDKVEEVFGELAAYAIYHFETEEELMHEYQVDSRHVAQHKKEHQDFLKEVTSMHTSLDLDNPESSQVLIKFLTYWLIYHILGSDQNMGKQILAIKSGTSPQQAYTEEEKELVNTTEPLLNAINGLFRIVSVRNHELLDLNQSLEKKVAERTKQLAVVNSNLEHLASTDMLTNLPNRRHAMYMIENLWAENKQALSCMMIDADGFKRINDTYGHDAGDIVLKVLARTLKDSVRTDDFVCRLGGDEFLIICPRTGHEGAMYLAENTRKLVNALIVPAGGGEWHGSISIGVATRNKEMTKPDHLIKAADQGVYLAKEAGRNCVKTIDS